MLQQTQLAATPKISEKRRGVRVNSRVPIAVEWDGDGKETVREETFTKVIGPYGCLLVLQRSLPVDKRIRIFNLATEGANAGTVVWKGNQRPEGWELGVELTKPTMDFWGLEV